MRRLAARASISIRANKARATPRRRAAPRTYMRFTSAKSPNRASPPQPTAPPFSRATKKRIFGWNSAVNVSPCRCSGVYSAASTWSSSPISSRTSAVAVVTNSMSTSAALFTSSPHETQRHSHLNIEFDRHVVRLHAGQRESPDEPFAHLADAAVIVDPHRQEIAPALVLLSAHRAAARNRDRRRSQDLVGAEARIFRNRGQSQHQ